MAQLIKSLRSHVSDTTNPTRKFLAFLLGTKEYCVDILNVSEIKGMKSISSLIEIASAPAYIKGIMNLNDNVIPTIDLRMLYKMKSDNTDFNAIVIVNSGDKYLGIIVDVVLDIIEIQDDKIKKMPEFLEGVHQEYINGVGFFGEKMVTIVDVKKLICNEHFECSNDAAGVT